MLRKFVLDLSLPAVLFEYRLVENSVHLVQKTYVFYKQLNVNFYAQLIRGIPIDVQFTVVFQWVFWCSRQIHFPRVIMWKSVHRWAHVATIGVQQITRS